DRADGLARPRPQRRERRLGRLRRRQRRLPRPLLRDPGGPRGLDGLRERGGLPGPQPDRARILREGSHVRVAPDEELGPGIAGVDGRHAADPRRPPRPPACDRSPPAAPKRGPTPAPPLTVRKNRGGPPRTSGG